MPLGAWKRTAAWLLIPVLLGACVRQPSDSGAEMTPTPSVIPTACPEEEDPIASLMAGMTLREKVGQLFLVRPDALDPAQSQKQIDEEDAPGVQQLTDPMREMMERYPVGGICQFGKNIADPEQIIRFNADLQEASALPLFLAVDEEGGPVARLANTPTFALPQYESAAAVGAAGDPDNACRMGQQIGNYLRQYGFNMDFAPVADVTTNPANTVIGNRAFSSKAGVAAAMAGAMARGLRQEGILPVCKHFPGHGDTAQDSHTGLAYTYRTKEEMRACEWLPFTAVVQDADPCAVMIGHIAAPSLDESGQPASLSFTVVTELLRQELLPDTEVLVVTDSLAMGAITEQYAPGEACVQAVLAGCDLLLMPDGLAEAFEAVVDAVEQGIIPEARLDESVARILRYKQQYAGL